MPFAYIVRKEEITDFIDNFRRYYRKPGKPAAEEYDKSRALCLKISDIADRPGITPWNIMYRAARLCLLERKAEEFKAYLKSKRKT